MSSQRSAARHANATSSTTSAASTISSSRAAPVHISNSQPHTRKRPRPSAESALEATQRAHGDEQQSAADAQPRKRAKRDEDDGRQPILQRGAQATGSTQDVAITANTAPWPAPAFPIAAAVLPTALSHSHSHSHTAPRGRAGTIALATTAIASGETDPVDPTWPLDLTGVSFMLVGNVSRGRIAQQLSKAGATITEAVAKVKQQYVVEGAPSQCTRKRTIAKEAKLCEAAKAAGKVFMTEDTFWKWMTRVDEYREEQQQVADSAGERLHDKLLQCTSLPDVLVDLVVEYAAAQEPVVGLFRDWLAMEQLASDGQFAATLPGPATLEEIKQLEQQYREDHRLPTWLRQLLRLHNGVRWVGEADAVLVPSLADMSFQVPREIRHTLRRLHWWAVRKQEGSHRRFMFHAEAQMKRWTFVAPTGQWVVIDDDRVDLYAHSLDDMLARYVNEWKRRIAAKEAEQGSEGEEGGRQQQEGEAESEEKEEAQPARPATTQHPQGTTTADPLLTTTTTSTTLSPTVALYASCRPPLASVSGEQQPLSHADPKLWELYRRSYRRALKNRYD